MKCDSNIEFTEYNYLIYRLSIIIEYKKMTAEAVI